MISNRKFLFGLLVLVFLSACTQTPEQREKKVKEKVRNATVNVQTDINNSGGSGFFVTSNKIVTNIHVLAGEPDIFVSVVGPKTTYQIEGVVGFDPEHDLVILQVKSEGTPLRLSKSKIGDQIFAAGYPAYRDEQDQLKRGEYKDDREGTISNIYNKGKQLQLKSNSEDSGLAPTGPGNSGGPVVNLEGEVVGVIVSSTKGGSKTQEFSQAVSTLVLKELMDKSNSVEPMSLSDWQKEPCVRAYVANTHGQKKLAAAESKNESVESKEETAVRKHLYGEAIEHFDTARELCSNFTANYGNRAAAKIRLGELETDQERSVILYYEAINDLSEAIKLNPADTRSHKSYAVAKFRLGELENNQGNTEKAQSLYNEILDDLAETVKLRPDVINIYAVAKFHLGELENNQGNTEKAQSLYNEILDDLAETVKLHPDVINTIEPNELNELNSGTAYSYYVRGGIELIRGEFKASQGDIEKVQKHYKNAFEFYDKAVKENPDDAHVYYDKAIKILNPDNADAYQVRGMFKTLLGQLKTKQGEVAGSRQHYQEAIEDYQEAVKRYADATKQNSEYIVSVYNNLGYTKYFLGKSFESESEQENIEHARNLYEEAIADCTKAVKLNPNCVNAYNYRGVAKAGIEDYDGAIADLSKAIELKPDSAKAYYKRGLVYQKIGRPKDASVDFKKARELDPSIENKPMKL